MVRQWTRAELIELARGRFLAARTVAGLFSDPPDWLMAEAAGLWYQDVSESLEHIHPDDRFTAVAGFTSSSASPGEPVSADVRCCRDGVWEHWNVTWLNLCDQEDVQALLSFNRVIDGPPIEPPVDGQRGEHAAAPWMVWTLADSAVVTAVDGAPGALLGYEPADIVGRQPTEFMADDTLSDTMAMWVNLVSAPGNTATMRRRFRRRDGSLVWIECSLHNRVDGSGENSVVGILWDASDRIAQERALADLAEDFRALADEVPAAVFRCDPSGAVLFHNARWTELVDDADGVGCLQDLVAPRDRHLLDEVLMDVALSDGDHRRSCEVGSIDGIRTWQVNLRPMGDGDRLIGSIEDVSVTVRLRREARQDALTGVLNRTGVEACLAEALTTDPLGTHVFFIDLDGFKAVNDTWGHDAGDVVLAEVARRLRAGVRPDDVVGRYGGDEFVVIGRGTRDASAQAMAGRLTRSFEGDIAFPGGTWSPSASIGWSSGRADDDPAAVLRRADQDMFGRKRSRTMPR